MKNVFHSLFIGLKEWKHKNAAANIHDSIIKVQLTKNACLATELFFNSMDLLVMYLIKLQKFYKKQEQQSIATVMSLVHHRLITYSNLCKRYGEHIFSNRQGRAAILLR